MRILVTGADGFIGSHLVEKLVLNGFDVNAFTYYNSFDSYGWLDHISPNIKNEINFFPGDIRDFNSVKNAIRGCNKVIHLAALIGIPYSYRSPQSYIDTNITGTMNVLQASRDLNVEKIIVTSTSEVYGSAQYVPMNEEHPILGQSPYAASKIASDQISLSHFLSFDLPVIILRPFNTYGPRQSLRAVIPSIITQAINDEKRIYLGSLEPTRDFNFIEDTVNGFFSALNSKSGIGEIINIGSGYEISIKEVVEIIGKILNKDIQILKDKRRERPQASEVNRLFACNKKAEKVLMWKPEYSSIAGLKKGITKTIEWFQNPNNLKYYNHNKYVV